MLTPSQAWTQPDILVQFLINGSLIAGWYILVAMGLNLVLGILDIADFAQGALYLVAAYVLLTFTTVFGIPFWIAAILSVLVVGIIGVANFLLVYQQLLDEDPIQHFLAAFGLFLFLQGFIFFQFGPDFQSIPTPISGSFEVSGIFINKMRLISLVATGLVVAITFYLINRTPIGKSIRAVAQNPQKAELLGLRSQRIYIMTFLIASLLSGIAAVLVAPSFTLDPFVALDTIVKGFIVAIIGGLGSIRGALVAGLFIGLLESYSLLFFSTEAANGMGFVILFFVLIFRPQGIFGSQGAAT
jgi:branched-chain amino acid transport system permease protein